VHLGTKEAQTVPKQKGQGPVLFFIENEHIFTPHAEWDVQALVHGITMHLQGPKWVKLDP
jgi:hypothetical protein